MNKNKISLLLFSFVLSMFPAAQAGHGRVTRSLDMVLRSGRRLTDAGPGRDVNRNRGRSQGRKPKTINVYASCTICFEELAESQERIVQLPCNADHTFHRKCFIELLCNNYPTTCPLCRRQFDINSLDFTQEEKEKIDREREESSRAERARQAEEDEAIARDIAFDGPPPLVENLVMLAGDGNAADVAQILLQEEIPAYLFSVAFVTAARYGRIRVVRIFINDRRTPPYVFGSALNAAVQYGHADIVVDILADQRTTAVAVNNALNIAAECGKLDELQLLLADEKISLDGIKNALRRAVAHNKENVIRELLNDERVTKEMISMALNWARSEGIRFMLNLRRDSI